MRPGLLNDNEHRSFPFLNGVVGLAAPSVNPTDAKYLPNSAIVDFGSLLGLDSEFISGTHTVYLFQVRRLSTHWEFEFRSSAPGLIGYSLTFCRGLTDPRYSVEHAIAELHGHAEDSLDSLCDDQPRWSGYLTTGNLADLAALLTVGHFLQGGITQSVEPALLQSQVKAFARSISLANVDRSRSTPPAGCRDYCWPFDIGSVFVHDVCLQGRLRFKPGFNSRISVNTVSNQIEIGAQANGGAGPVCDEIPLFVGDVPPTGSDLLTGGPRCNQTIRSINGIGGSQFSITAASGVTITDKPDSHEVEVLIDMLGLAVGVVVTPAMDCGPLSVNGDPCECGDSV